MNTNERDSYIKFFFLIDSDKIVENIAEKMEKGGYPKRDYSAQNIFSDIFSEIEKACSLYMEFLRDSKSFNNSPGFDNPWTKRNNNSQYDILSRILLNHCVLHAFMDKIEADDAERTIKISGAKDLQLKSGYWRTARYTKKPEVSQSAIDANLNISQSYNQYKERFRKNESRYAYQLLRKNSVSTGNDFLCVPCYKGNWSCFLYTNKQVHTLNKNIATYGKKMISSYNKLYEAALEWPNQNNLCPEDRFLFEHAMESIYGFSFFYDTARLLHKMHEAPLKDDGMTLKDIEGSMILSYIQKFAQLPITYNRSVFLEYAICRVVFSTSLGADDYKKGEKRLFEHLSSVPASKTHLISSGFGHIERYIQKLKYLVLPLLEDVWAIVIEKLNRRGIQHKNDIVNIETYRAYIRENYDLITKKYYYDFDNETLVGLAEPAENPLESLISKYERDSFGQLLSNYFEQERFSEQPKLCDLVLPYARCIDDHELISKHTREYNFCKGHSSNILIFAENIDTLAKR